MTNSIQKGKAGERELAHELRKYGFEDARRTQQFCGNTGDASDCVGLDGIHIECKRQEKVEIWKWMQQAINDSQKTGNIPTVFHRKNKQTWLVTMKLEDWISLYKRGINNGYKSNF